MTLNHPSIPSSQKKKPQTNPFISSQFPLTPKKKKKSNAIHHPPESLLAMHLHRAMLLFAALSISALGLPVPPVLSKSPHNSRMPRKVTIIQAS